MLLTEANLLNSRGRYQGVFAYSFHKFAEANDLHVMGDALVGSDHCHADVS
jgi:hypothetical protein